MQTARSIGLTLLCGTVACDAGRLPTTTPGESVYRSDVTVIEYVTASVYTLPPGQACDPAVSRTTLDLDDHVLSWSYCAVIGDVQTPNKLFVPKSGERALDDTMFEHLEPSLSALTVVGDDDRWQCEADMPSDTMRVSTSAGTVEYGNSRYECAPDTRPRLNGYAIATYLSIVGGGL